VEKIIRSNWKNWTTALLLAVGLFVLYLTVLPDHLVTINDGGDGGDFLSAMLTHGIPHPTGYPTYMILGQLFLRIPISSPYFRVALLSALASACAAGLLFLWVTAQVVRDHKLGWLAGIVAALAWGTAPLVFSQAGIVEVYGLQSLFFMINLWWISLLSRRSESLKSQVWLSLLAFIVGMSLGNHLTILFLAPVWVYSLIVFRKKGNPSTFLILQIALLLAGGLIYLYLPLSARNYPPVNWGNPQSWTGFWWEVSGKAYQGMLFQIPFVSLVGRIGAAARLLLDQFGILGLVIGLVGAVISEKIKSPIRWILAWLFFSSLIFSLGYNTKDSYLYLIPSLTVFSIWLGIGAIELFDIKWRSLPLGNLAGLALLLFLIVRIPFTRQTVDARKDNRAILYAENYLRSAPQNAILLTNGDEDTFPLWYYHFGLKQRPDIRIILLPLTQFVWYQETVRHTYPDLVLPPDIESSSTAWGDAISKLNPERPVCESRPDAKASYGVAVSCPMTN